MEGTLKPPYICDEFIKNLETEIREKEKDNVLIREFITVLFFFCIILK